jgi:hypothetical protein
MIESVAFAAGLAGASMLTMNASPALQRTALALAGNWLACIVVVLLMGVVDPWAAFAAADAVAAFIVLSHPASRPQAVIGCIYIVQITVHLAYALVGSGPATGLYLNMLSGGGWLQIAVLAGGAIHGSGKRWAVSRGMGCVGSPVVASSQSRLAEGERKRC